MEASDHKRGPVKPILLLGVGNSIQQDDGVGIQAISTLMDREWPDEVELYDGGTLGIDLLPVLQERHSIIVIDAVDGSMAPGTLYRFTPEEISSKTTPYDSLHQLGFIETLHMAQILGTEPKHVVILGCQPHVVDWGLELTPTVSEKLPRILELATEETLAALKKYQDELKATIQVEG